MISMPQDGCGSQVAGWAARGQMSSTASPAALDGVSFHGQSYRHSFRRVHLVGAAGAGMSALASLLEQAGCRLSGSDSGTLRAGSPAWLRSGHAPGHVPPNCDLLVFSPAVAADNPELMAARRRGLPTLSYPEMVGRLMAEHRGLAVAGTHGKSTTTAMAADILAAAGLNATVLCGATPIGAPSGGRLGSSDLLLAEACEYRGHFHQLRPAVAVLLGIEWDHVDCFATVREVEAAFADFVAGMPRDGRLLVADRCRRSLRIATRSGRRYERFGTTAGADWQAAQVTQDRGRHHFQLRYRGQPLTSIGLQVRGLHNLENALAAAALSWHAGAPAAGIERGLAGFRGLRRRLEYLGRRRGVALVDDYAHHPTEVAASLAALRNWFGRRRICCVFQPHQVARTRALLDEFAGSMHNADLVAVADVYLAREPQASEEQGGAERSLSCPTRLAAELARRLAARGTRVAPVHALEDIQTWLRAFVRPGDVLVTMGAGDIGKFAHEFV